MASDNNLSERLDFIGFDQTARRDIADIKATLMRELPGALDIFYRKVRSHPDTRKFFTSDQHMDAAKSRQVGHWQAISSGQFDDGYLRAVTAVGDVHARIGLEPRWYIGGYALVLEHLIARVLEDRWPKGMLGGRRDGAAKVGAELGALAKATLLDMDLAISVYLDRLAEAREAADRARRETEEAQAVVVAVLAERLSQMADGDLTVRIDEDFQGAHARIKDDFNRAVARLEEAMAGVAHSIEGLNGSSEEIASASEDLSRRTEQQAANLEETAAAMDQITETVKRSAEGAKRAAAVATEARTQALRSGEVMDQAVAAMGEIEESSGRVAQIIGVIDEIAFQTNLLALNAGVEAARAGDAGRGFAVVAQEVRALAQRSADAAKEIKALISRSSTQVGAGVKLVGETGKALSGIVERVSEIDHLIAEISQSSQEQSGGLGEVNVAVNQMDQFTQQNAAMVEEATAAVGSLKVEAAALARQVARFRMSRAATPERAAVVAPSRPAPSRPARVHRGGGVATAAAVAPDTNGWDEF
jgi:methyl-accepting chemotaxis protein